MTEPDPLAPAGMFRMFEGYLLSRNPKDPGSVFSRIAFRQPDAGVVARRADRPGDVPGVKIDVADSIPFSSFEEVVASTVVDDAATGCQHVWFVRHAAGNVYLDRISLTASVGSEGRQALKRTTYPLAAKWVRSIAGEARWHKRTRSLLVGGTSDEGAVVGAFDASSGTITSTWTLPASKPGTLVGSWILTQDFATWLFVTVRTPEGLSTAALDVCSLAPGEPVPPADVRFLPDVPVAAGSGVNGTLGKMLPKSASQQLILAATDPSGVPFVVLQGFDAGKPAQLARATVDTAFAKPRSSEYRVTCADLDNNGQEELVVAYPADYGGVTGAGAFVLFRFDTKHRTLEATSRYVADGPAPAALASMDLRLGSGILGDVKLAARGVFVLGAGGDWKHVKEGESQIFAGIVPVNPITLRFPPYTEVPATLPNVTQVAVTAMDAPGILGSVADLFGLSVTLGPPVLTQLSSRGQLLAILQVPPFDQEATALSPSLSFSESDNKVTGLSVASSKDWMLSVDAGMSLGIDASSLSFHASTSYGRGFSKTEGSSTTTGVAISRDLVLYDRLVTIAVDYSVWRYPIMRASCGKEPGGTMLVIFPGSAIPVQATPVAYDLGYRAPYETGSLLTYMNVDLDGWDETRQGELLLFTPLASLEVTSDQPDTNTYDRSRANERTIGKNYFVAGTTSTSASLLKSTRLFGYLPASFGFDLGTSESYTDGEMETTSVSRTESLSISVRGGTVEDASLAYTVIPYIYQHAGLGATVVAFRVSKLGPGWRRLYPDAYPMLILPWRGQRSEDPLQRTFSRSISFAEQPDGTVDIEVEVFNRGYTDAQTVTAALYRGQPKFGEKGPIIPPDKDLIGPPVTGRVVALGRQRMKVKWTPAEKPSCVTAVVWGDGRPEAEAEIAWNIYPESAYPSLGLPAVEDA